MLLAYLFISKIFKYEDAKMRKDRYNVSSTFSLPIQEIEAATLSKTKQVFLKISQNSQENTCPGVFLINLQGSNL